MQPLVSFLLPAYKVQHLDKAIKSILNQSFNDFELIVVNDCSPDDIENIVKKYHDDRLRYYKNGKNIGGKDLVAQWNQCLNYAKGEWSVMASDDDIYHPDFLQEMISLSEKYPQNDVFHCNILTIDDNDRIIDVSHQIGEHETILQNFYYRMTYQRIEAFQDYFIRTSRLKQIGGYLYFPLATFSDITTIVSIAGNNGIICSNKYLFKWRCNGKNISTNPNTCIDRIKACEKLISWIESNYSMFDFLDDEVSLWIKERFLSDIHYKTTESVKYLVQQMPIEDLKAMLKQKNWTYRLIDRKYVKRNRLVRIKNTLTLR